MGLICCRRRSPEDKYTPRKQQESQEQNPKFIDSRDQGQQGRPYETESIADDAVNQERGSHGKSNGTEDKVPLVANATEQSRMVSDIRMKDQSYDTNNESSSDGIYPGGSRNLSYRDESHALQRAGSQISFTDKGQELDILKRQFDEERRKYEEDLQRKTEQIKQLEKDKNELLNRQEIDNLTREFNEERRKYEKDLQSNREQIEQLKEEKNELLNSFIQIRLSSQAAARMTYDNPNITDLSDQNRPTKLSERYSELYDNQWTDAFEYLQNKYQQSETETIAFLLDVLYVSFDVCKEARQLREDLLKALKGYIGEDGDVQDVTILEVMRTLKGTKRNIRKMQKEFKENVQRKMATETNYKDKLQDIILYMDECVEICLLMNIQEPPVELKRLEPLYGAPFDLSVFKPYTESGNIIEYIVWPAMYLYLDGPLLCKGIAQGKHDSSNVHTPMSAKHDANEKEFAKEVSGQEKDPKWESMTDQVLNDTNVNTEQKEHKEKLIGSPTLTGSHRESSSYQSQKETEKHRTQYDETGSSLSTYISPTDETTQSTKSTPDHSPRTGQQENVEKSERMTSELGNIAEICTHL